MRTVAQEAADQDSSERLLQKGCSGAGAGVGVGKVSVYDFVEGGFHVIKLLLY